MWTSRWVMNVQRKCTDYPHLNFKSPPSCSHPLEEENRTSLEITAKIAGVNGPWEVKDLIMINFFTNMMSLDQVLAQKTKKNYFAIHLMVSYLGTAIVKWLFEMSFFTINIYNISSWTEILRIPKFVLGMIWTLNYMYSS